MFSFFDFFIDYITILPPPPTHPPTILNEVYITSNLYPQLICKNVMNAGHYVEHGVLPGVKGRST